MAVNINIDVNDPGGLLRINKTQVAANRAVQEDRESRKDVEKKAAPRRREALESRQDISANRKSVEEITPTPKIQEPAANRFVKFPSIGHAWLFANEIVFAESTGYLFLANGRVRPDRPVIRQTILPFYFVSGSGNVWNELNVEIRDNFDQASFTSAGSGTFAGYPVDFYVGTRSTILDHPVIEQILGFPCGDGNFIFIHVYDKIQRERTTQGLYRTSTPQDSVSAEDLLATSTFYSVNETASNEREYVVYISSNTGLRKINIPDKTKGIVDDLWPQPSFVTTARTTYTWTAFPGFDFVKLFNWDQYSWTFNYDKIDHLEDNGIVLPDFNEKIISPFIFENIQGGYPFTEKTMINATEQLRIPIADIRSAGYSNFDQNGNPLEGYEFPTLEPMYNLNSQFKYGLGRTKGTPPSLSDWVNGPRPISSNKMTLKMNANRQPAEGTSEFQPPATFREERLYISTDGAKPGYCRSMMLELGFTNADLKP